jgi:hypothetical protein
LVHLNDLSSLAVLVEQDREGYVLVFDEGGGVSSAAGAEGCDSCPGFQDLSIPLTDLTGPFPARQSAKVAQKEEHVTFIRPQVAEAVGRAVGIGQ